MTDFTSANEATGQSDSRTTQKKLYGDDFPADFRLADGKAWKQWADAVIKQQDGVMRDKRLYWSRNRHFRQGRQWISSRDGRTWREIDADVHAVRQVLDVISPALDFRLGILGEQKPGFRVYPTGTGTEGREHAEAQQQVAEHYYNRRNGFRLLRDGFANAQTDGVGFLQVYIDKSEGPVRENVELVPPTDPRYLVLAAQGYTVRPDGNVEVPLNAADEPQEPGTEAVTYPAGDINHRVVLASEVTFDPEAKTINGPYDKAKWCIVRRVRDLKTARLETGDETLEADPATTTPGDPVLDTHDPSASATLGFQRGLPPFPTSRLRNREGVWDYLIYLAPNAGADVADGYWCHVVGDKKLDGADELPGKKIPLARLTDGSSDSEMFPRPIMSDWLPDQMAINAIYSKIIEQMRHAVGRLLSQKGALITESYSTIAGSVVEYTGSKPEFMTGPRVAPDHWQALQFAIRKLEDKTGWTDLARGRPQGEAGGLQDVSGRALLGTKELYERQFGPMLRAAAEGMSEWAVLVVDYARYLFTTPRLIPVAGRGDLAKQIEAGDLGTDSLVYVEPETLMPLPRALRNQMLYDMFEKGLISRQQYFQRAPYAELRDVHYGGLDQWTRAQMLNTTLEEKWEQVAALPNPYDPAGQGLAVWWQDDPSVHKTALAELILDERKPWGLRDLAAKRSAIYDQLQRAKGVDDLGNAISQPQPMLIPPVVLGVPDDFRMAMQPQPPQQPMPPEQPSPGGGPPGQGAVPPGGGGMAPIGGEGMGETAQPLGSFGAIEQASLTQ